MSATDLCSWALKTYKDRATTASLGDLLQDWSNLLKKTLLVSSLNLQGCKQGCYSPLYPLTPLHHLCHIPVFHRPLLDPSSPKTTTSAHTASMLWSTAREKSLISTKVDPQICLQFGNFRLLGQRLLNLHTTFNFMAQTDHKTSSWYFIIASFQLKAFKCIKIKNVHENTKYQAVDFCPQRELSVYDKKGFALLWVSYQT